MVEEYKLSKWRITRTQAENGFNVLAGHTLVYNELEWKGSGPEGYFLVTGDTTFLPNTPFPPLTKIDTDYVRISFAEVRDQFFPSVSVHNFVNVIADIDSTFVTFDLQREVVP